VRVPERQQDQVAWLHPLLQLLAGVQVPLAVDRRAVHGVGPVEAAPDFVVGVAQQRLVLVLLHEHHVLGRPRLAARHPVMDHAVAVREQHGAEALHLLRKGAVRKVLPRHGMRHGQEVQLHG
jgi:hypothetical protein